MLIFYPVEHVEAYSMVRVPGGMVMNITMHYEPESVHDFAKGYTKYSRQLEGQ